MLKRRLQWSVRDGSRATHPALLVQVEVKEVDRLAAVVTTIQQESAVVPKGAFMLTPDNAVVRNKAFQGLSTAEAECVDYYLHFSPPQSSVSNVRHFGCVIIYLQSHPSILQDIHKLFLYQDTVDKDHPRGVIHDFITDMNSCCII